MKSFGSRGTKLVIVIGLLLALAAVFYFKSRRSPEQAVEVTPRTRTNSARVRHNEMKTSVPRLLELGADRCVPCKMMAPILGELRDEYSGNLEVISIDVWKNPDAIKRYGIRSIPTQIFYDASGRELFRHVGFLSKEDILAKWKELGIAVGKGQNNQKDR